MNILIYAHKRNFDVQKAERYFKERRVNYHFIDLKKRAPGLRELQTIKSQVGVRALIDTESQEYQAHYIGHLTEESTILEALAAHPLLLKTPIVRNGNKATVGYKPEVWETWRDA